MIFLHELFHIDLAADSVNGQPNPKIYDIVIRWKDPEGNTRGPNRAYTARFSKLLARFLPSNKAKDPKSTGYWVQRNVDNFSRYAMAKYLEGKIGGYPFLPIIYDKLLYPMDPPTRPGKSSFIAFEAGDEAKVDVDTSDLEALDGGASIDAAHTTEDVFELGQPIDADQYPESYKQAYAGWLDLLNGNSDGICKVEVRQIWTCEDPASNLYAELKITDANGNVLYTTPDSVHSPGLPINDANPLELHEPGMDESLFVTGEHTGDYIQFSYGSTSWRSTDNKGDASCQLVGDNWDTNGPQGCPTMALVSQFLAGT